MEELILDPIQVEAIDTCCDIANRVVAVAGAAGTGKTTILKKVRNSFVQAGYRTALCSPTGKAAKRIYEVTGIEASTIHRLLKYSHPGDIDPKTGKPMGESVPTYNRSYPLPYDVILADEYAMVNSDVHRALFDALAPGAIIRCFGDDNQLRPIEEDKRKMQDPSPFLQILRNPKLKSVILKHVFRQGADSGILLNAHSLLKSKMPTRNDQWTQKITDRPVDELRAYIQKCEAEGISFASLDNQVIVPQNKGWVGTVALNQMIQGLYRDEYDPDVFLPRKDSYHGDDGPKKQEDIAMYVGDKVIYTANNYDLGIFNGESGILVEADEDTGEIVVDFGDREQTIPPIMMTVNRYGKEVSYDPRRELDLAYAITVHKSQGSEYKRVVYIINKSNMYMLNRRNFYTAITRAKEHVMVFADQKGLQPAVYRKD